MSSDDSGSDPADDGADFNDAARWRDLPHEDVPVPSAAGPGWDVFVRWVIDGDDVVPAAVTLHAPPGEPVTAVALRRVKITEVIGGTRQRARVRLLGRAWLADRYGEPLGFDARAAAAALAAGPGKRGRRRQYGDDHYREVARVYLAAEATGAPVRAVAEAFGLSATDTSAKGWVQRARALGFLPPMTTTTTKGSRDDG